MKTLFNEDDKVRLILLKCNRPFTNHERRTIAKKIGHGFSSGFFHKNKYHCIFTLMDGVYNVHLVYRDEKDGSDKKGHFVLKKVTEK
jgi:hypothetical protein